MDPNTPPRLTSLERRALGLANTKAGAPVGSTRSVDRKEVARAVANRLKLKGFAEILEGTLRITKEGQRALNAVLPAPDPVYLHRRDGLTTMIHLAARGEPEVMNADDLRPDWAEAAESRRRLERAQADAVRLSGLAHPLERLDELKRMAAERRKDIRGDLRQLEHVMRRIERKVAVTDEEAA